MPWRSSIGGWPGSWRGSGGGTPPVTPPALVQKRAQSLSAGGSTYGASFLANLASTGSQIILVFAGQNVDAPTGIAGFGATWAFHTVGVSSPNFKSITIAIGYNPTATSGTVVVTKAALGGNECSVLYEVTGLKKQDAVQAATGSFGTTVNGVAPSTAAYTAQAANDLVVAAVNSDLYSGAPGSIGAPTGTPAGQVLSLDAIAYSNSGNISLWSGLFISDATHQTQLTAGNAATSNTQNVARATAEYAHA